VYQPPGAPDPIGARAVAPARFGEASAARGDQHSPSAGTTSFAAITAPATFEVDAVDVAQVDVAPAITDDDPVAVGREDEVHAQAGRLARTGSPTERVGWVASPGVGRLARILTPRT